MSVPDGPRVSVVIPAYRVTPYIGQALDSVLKQTYPPFEVLVVNDECPDTPALERELERYTDRIRYLTRSNGGPGAARNTGIRAAAGELIAFLDADDYWAPTFLERQVELLTARDRDLVYSDATYFDDSGAVVGSLMERSPSRGEADLEALLSGRCTVATSTVVARKAALEAAGLFDEDIGNYSEDFDLWCRVAHAGGRLGYRTERLVFHRVHGTSLTSQRLALPRGALRVLRKLRDSLDLSVAEQEALTGMESRISAAVLTEEAKTLVDSGRYQDARARLKEAVRRQYSLKRHAVLWGLRLAPGLIRRLQRTT